MSDNIPFEMQSEIIKKLPAKSLLQFRSVSKQWKSFIDNPKFIKNYHIQHPNPQHHLLVQYKIDSVQTYEYTSIVDDNTFPKQMFPLTTPELLNKLVYRSLLGSVDGLVCFYGLYKDIELETYMVVVWNPSVRKCVGIVIPNVFNETLDTYTRIAFGVCPETNDPKLVKINVIKTPTSYWEVQVFTLSSRVWRTVYTGPPFKSCALMYEHVFVDGIIYWCSHGPRGSIVISFDLKSEKFGQVSIPERFVGNYGILVKKVNESLGLLEYYDEEGGLPVCGVWMKKDGVNKPFTKIYTIKAEGKPIWNTSVLGFRNNGDVVLRIVGVNYQEESTIEVYEPSSGRISGVGIKGVFITLSASSYMETLLLLDEPNTIIF